MEVQYSSDQEEFKEPPKVPQDEWWNYDVGYDNYNWTEQETLAKEIDVRRAEQDEVKVSWEWKF